MTEDDLMLLSRMVCSGKASDTMYLPSSTVLGACGLPACGLAVLGLAVCGLLMCTLPMCILSKCALCLIQLNISMITSRKSNQISYAISFSSLYVHK